MMPAMLAQYFTGQMPPGKPGGDPGKGAVDHFDCTECGHHIPKDAKFCPFCGHQQLVFQKCVQCGKNLAPNARFCSRCGNAVEEKPAQRYCPNCGAEGLGDAKFCGECGEKY
jgi:predicted amidophosphoribosyltransferase